MATKKITIRIVVVVGLLFLPALFMTALGTLQEIPDDKVFTDIQKTFINGTWGILTCRFIGQPYAVYWKKGHDPWTSPTLMTWTSDGKTGPRYEDGTCDMDENYSLIIKTVDYTDAGRYICLVSNQHGVLIDNFTDVRVTDIALETKPTLSTEISKTGVLPCQVNIRPKKVSWMRSPDIVLITIDLIRNVIERSGPGYEEGLFNMTKEYSLIIRDVKIQHQGRYLCEVIDFDTDNVYRDITILSVFAQPREPYPIIEGCPTEDQTNCIITTDSSITLTCHVNEYYPDVDLFFVHGSKRVDSLKNQSWNNTDGTRNKSTMISADTSKDSYKCIASGIPGLGNNDEVWASVRLIQEQRNSLILTVLLIPIVLCLAVALLTWIRLRKRGRRSSKEERYMKGHVLYVELWKLVEYAIENDESPKLVDLIILLNGEEGSQRDMDQEYYYQQLCRWKETCGKRINQRTALYKKCRKFRLHETVHKLEEFRLDTSTAISPSEFEHILWHISEPLKMKKFLASLGMKMEKESELNQRKTIVEEALQSLKTWKPNKLGFLNPVIIISSTMEVLGYCTSDKNFFQIPTEKKDKIQDHVVQKIERKLKARHWEKVERIMKTNEGGLKSNNANENDEVLFSIQKMLRDWLENAECSNYDKRCKLQRLSYELASENESPANDHWASDEELKVIARYLNSASMKSVCDKLHIASPHEKADENQRFKALCQWRASTSAMESMLVYDQLRSVLEEVGIPGLLPSLINDPISKAKCVDIAFDLMMTDVLPVAKALGININKLPAYRPVFEPSHLEKGTIGVITHLVESTKKDDCRLVFCRRLLDAGFPLATERNLLVKQMGYGELYAISDAMREDVSRHGINDTNDDDRQEREVLLADNKTSIEMNAFVGQSQEDGNKEKDHYSELKKMLKLTEEELPVRPLHHDVFTLFNTWKVRPSLALSNDRTAIISGLLDIQRPDIATSVGEGKFFVQEVSLHFIMSIIKKMDESECARFAKSFNLQNEFEGARGSDDEISKIIHGFLRKWESKFKLPVVGKEDGVPLIDKLVDNGFLDIARELNIIHYQNKILGRKRAKIL